MQTFARLNSGDSVSERRPADETDQALWSLAQSRREQCSGQVVAISDSVDSAIACQMIRAVLSCDASHRATAGSADPASLLEWDGNGRHVIELTAGPQQLVESQVELWRPNIGVLTRSEAAWYAGIGEREQSNPARLLLAGLKSDQIVVINGDDPRLRRWAGRCAAQVCSVGRGADCDFSASHVDCGSGRLVFQTHGRRMTLRIWGRHHLASALAAVAVGRLYGLEWPAIADALAGFTPSSAGSQVRAVNGVHIIDDGRLPDRRSLRDAMRMLRDFDSPGKRIVVCGDLRESGVDSARSLRELGEDVVTQCGADVLVACGRGAMQVVAGALAAGMTAEKALACQDEDDALARLRQMASRGDVILIKGARGAAAQRLLEAISADHCERAA